MWLCAIWLGVSSPLHASDADNVLLDHHTGNTAAMPRSQLGASGPHAAAKGGTFVIVCSFNPGVRNDEVIGTHWGRTFRRFKDYSAEVFEVEHGTEEPFSIQIMETCLGALVHQRESQWITQTCDARSALAAAFGNLPLACFLVLNFAA